MKVYEEVMTSRARAKIILGVIVKSIVTFGMYYFIYEMQRRRQNRFGEFEKTDLCSLCSQPVA